jgi:signal peptidase I
MWPTYNGMTYELFDRDQEPGPLARAGRLLAFGATRYGVTAPTDGEVLVPVAQYAPGTYGLVPTSKPGRVFLLFPTVRDEYAFSVGGDLVTITVPTDFDFYSLLSSKLGLSGRERLLDFLSSRVNDQTLKTTKVVENGGRQSEISIYWVSLGLNVAKGQHILSFDILTGDLLFVDRITYNFFQPKIGQGFVFKTENIHSRYMLDDDKQKKQYYIKRLVGQAGDTLEVKSPVLLRNGQPIQGAAAFDKNARRQDKYPGYAAVQALSPGNLVTVAPQSFYAMGDNSTNSADSRYWGFVPEKDVVGRPLFIYYPLSKRWGPAH